MKVAVVGAGAIGAYVGAALHRAGADVHLIARGAHLAAIRRDGVRVLSPRGDFTDAPARDRRPERGRPETLDVAERPGCRPPVSIARRLAGAERAGHHKTSTLRDLERGRPLELDVILAAVVEFADLTGARLPTLRAINAVAGLVNRKILEAASSAGKVREVAGS